MYTSFSIATVVLQETRRNRSVLVFAVWALM
jgi:hypothetical protein